MKSFEQDGNEKRLCGIFFKFGFKALVLMKILMVKKENVELVDRFVGGLVRWWVSLCVCVCACVFVCVWVILCVVPNIQSSRQGGSSERKER